MNLKINQILFLILFILLILFFISIRNSNNISKLKQNENNKSDQYTVILGNLINLNNFLNIATRLNPNINAYGANTTVSYIGAVYQGYTNFDEIIPYYKLGPDDYILLELDIGSPATMANINLINFTNYAYKTTYNGETANTFASVDQTIQTFDTIKNYNSTIKICICTSMKVATEYDRQGYQISRISLDLINPCEFNWLIRVGVNKNFALNTSLKKRLKTTLFKSKSEVQLYSDNNYFTKSQIEARWPQKVLPLENPMFTFLTDRYLELISYINNFSSPTKKEAGQVQPYLSNFNGNGQGMYNIWDAMSVKPMAQLQANETGKVYMMTDMLDLKDAENGYIYIVALNWGLTYTSISSNLQIYGAPSFQAIENGTCMTGPEYAVTQNLTYPYNNVNQLKLPPFLFLNIQLMKY